MVGKEALLYCGMRTNKFDIKLSEGKPDCIFERCESTLNKKEINISVFIKEFQCQKGFCNLVESTKGSKMEWTN